VSLPFSNKCFIKLLPFNCLFFREVNVLLEGAVDNLSAISQAELTAVRGVKTASPSLRINMEVICLLKNIKPGMEFRKF